MDSLQQELGKLESKTSGGAIQASIASIDETIEALQRWRDMVANQDDMTDGDSEAKVSARAVDLVKAASTKLADTSKDWNSAINKYGKALDKKFTVDVTALLPAPSSASGVADNDDHMFFSSQESKNAIDNILALHFARSGREDIADTFIKESGVHLPQEKLIQFSALHRVTAAIRQGNLGPAFEWVDRNRTFLNREGRFYSPLEFHLHRSQYMRLLLSDTHPLPSSLSSYASAAQPTLSNGFSGPPKLQGPQIALAYARTHFGPFYRNHMSEILRLSTAALYLPLPKLLASPYADLLIPAGSTVNLEKIAHSNLADDLYHAPHLVNLFASEFCRSLAMSKDLPLSVVTDVGGSGALAKIAKVRGMMKDKRTEWTTVQELPIDIPVPNEYRYHSIFACPVSKEQATEANPPMMMPCGHVVADQSLRRLCKGGQNVRCPYCPLSSAVSQAIRVYF